MAKEGGVKKGWYIISRVETLNLPIPTLHVN